MREWWQKLKTNRKKMESKIKKKKEVETRFKAMRETTSLDEFISADKIGR